MFDKRVSRVGLFVKRQASVRSFQSLTLVGLAVMAIAVIGFGANIGIVSISVGIVLAVIDPKAARAALTKVSWSVVVLITGVLAYIYILEQAGTVAWVSNGIMSLGVPLLYSAPATRERSSRPTKTSSRVAPGPKESRSSAGLPWAMSLPP